MRATAATLHFWEVWASRIYSIHNHTKVADAVRAKAMPIAMILNKLPQEQVDVRLPPLAILLLSILSFASFAALIICASSISVACALTVFPNISSPVANKADTYVPHAVPFVQIQVAKMKWENRKVMLQMQLLPHYTTKADAKS
jgi:hypothetical protein